MSGWEGASRTRFGARDGVLGEAYRREQHRRTEVGRNSGGGGGGRGRWGQRVARGRKGIGRGEEGGRTRRVAGRAASFVHKARPSAPHHRQLRVSPALTRDPWWEGLVLHLSRVGVG